MKKIILLVALSAALWACSEPKYNCAYNIAATLNTVEKGDTTTNINLVGYIFYSDTLVTQVASYNDARDGILTERSGGKKLSYNLKGDYSTDDKSIFTIREIKNTPIVVVVCDTLHHVYAYRNAEIDRGLANIYVNLPFFTWRLTVENSSYKSGGWVVIKE